MLSTLLNILAAIGAVTVVWIVVRFVIAYKRDRQVNWKMYRDYDKS